MISINLSRFESTDKAHRYYLSRIDELVEEARVGLPGKSAAHEAKYREALAYPEGEQEFLKRESEATSTPIVRLVDKILLARKRWEKRDAKLEALRVSTRRKIRARLDPVEMEEVIQQAMVTLDEIG